MYGLNDKPTMFLQNSVHFINCYLVISVKICKTLQIICNSKVLHTCSIVCLLSKASEIIKVMVHARYACHVHDMQVPNYFAGVYRGELSRNDVGHMQHCAIEDDTLALYDPNSNSVQYYQIGE
mgnify:CR=1 FL=1